MWIGKIGQKSAAFINHKPFHPANWQNQEKIWLAEQKHKEELRKQAELAERREEELKIQELRRALYAQGYSGSAAAIAAAGGSSTSSILGEKRKKGRGERAADDPAAAAAREAQQRKRQAAEAAARRQAEQRRKETAVKSSLYEEDVKQGTHTQIWGSYYEAATQLWGYACCRCCNRRQLQCPIAPASPLAAASALPRSKRKKLSKRCTPEAIHMQQLEGECLTGAAAGKAEQQKQQDNEGELRFTALEREQGSQSGCNQQARGEAENGEDSFVESRLLREGQKGDEQGLVSNCMGRGQSSADGECGEENEHATPESASSSAREVENVAQDEEGRGRLGTQKRQQYQEEEGDVSSGASQNNEDTLRNRNQNHSLATASPARPLPTKVEPRADEASPPKLISKERYLRLTHANGQHVASLQALDPGFSVVNNAAAAAPEQQPEKGHVEEAVGEKKKGTKGGVIRRESGLANVLQMLKEERALIDNY